MPDAPRDAVLLPEARPYWLRYAGHLVEFGSLPRPFRLMAQVATALALLGLLTLTLPLGHLSAVPLPAAAHMRVPDLVLAVGTVLQLGGWWYLLAGSATVSAALRWPVVLAFILFQLQGLFASPLAVLTMILTVVYAIFTSVRRIDGRRSMALAAGIVLLYYLLALRAGSATFTVLTLSQVAMFYLLFLPVLFYSGFDLGETGLFFTRLGLWHLHPRMSAAGVWWLALLLIVAKAAWIIHYWHPYSWNLPLSLVLLVVGVWLTHRLTTHAEPPEFLPFAFSLLIFAALFGTAAGDLIWSVVAFGALLAGVVMALVARTRRHLASSAIFLLLFGLWNLFSISDRIGSPVYAFGVPAITEPSLDAAITIGALAYLIYLRLRGDLRVERVMLIIFWIVGFTLILGTWNLLESLHSLTHGLVTAEALLLLVGIAHEVAASGGMLNRGSPSLPRTARVLLYLGYLLLLSGATVLAAGTHGAISQLANIDDYQQAGLLIIGMPLFLQQFLHAFAFGHRSHPEGEARTEGDAGPHPAQV